ncbi:MAG TPA: cell division protein FtsH, partial [Pseudogracilibacillus sp.]|nr:cell division protein FtsH [Pseudogracilibacillus sp.]
RDLHNEKNYSESIARAIDEETQNFINTCYTRAKDILLENQDKLELIAEQLLEVETLDADQIKSLFEDGVMPERTAPKEVEEKSSTEEAATSNEEITSKEEPVAEETQTEANDNDVKINIQAKEDEASDKKE